MIAVICNVAFAVLVSGQRTNLNVTDLPGLKTGDAGDFIEVNFSHTRPKGYMYISEGVLLVRENDCLYPNGTD